MVIIMWDPCFSSTKCGGQRLRSGELIRCTYLTRSNLLTPKSAWCICHADSFYCKLLIVEDLLLLQPVSSFILPTYAIQAQKLFLIEFISFYVEVKLTSLLPCWFCLWKKSCLSYISLVSTRGLGELLVKARM